MIHFMPGRVRFKGAEASAPFPSVIVVYLPKCKVLPLEWAKP